MRVRLRRARAADLPFIRRGARLWKLDDERLAARQFIVAENGAGRRIGFGRIKPYRTCHELGTVGVLPKYRGIGVGKALIQKLIGAFPTPTVWITTELFDYFRSFGFRVRRSGPAELREKIIRVCRVKGRRNCRVMSLRRSPGECLSAGRRPGAFALLLALALPAAAAELCGPLRLGKQPLRLTRHASERIEQRHVRCEDLQAALRACAPFRYRHEGKQKTGCYGVPQRLFVATADGAVLTVISEATPSYVERLRRRDGGR